MTLSSTPESPESRPADAPPSERASWSPSPSQPDTDPDTQRYDTQRYDTQRSEPPPVAPPPVHSEPGLRLARHLTCLLVGLILTPAGIGLLAYGGNRYLRMLTTTEFEHDTRGLAALAGGGLVLLIVACLGAWSPAGPLLCGLVYGLAPAAIFLAVPDDAVDWVVDAPVVSTGVESGTLSLLAVGGFLAIGATLVGGGFAAALRRG
jgi:hypothetical protein